MSNPHVVYRPRQDATQRAELSALAACYRFLLDFHAKKVVTRPGAPDDVPSITNPEGVSDVGRRSR